MGRHTAEKLPKQKDFYKEARKSGSKKARAAAALFKASHPYDSLTPLRRPIDWWFIEAIPAETAGFVLPYGYNLISGPVTKSMVAKGLNIFLDNLRQYDSAPAEYGFDAKLASLRAQHDVVLGRLAAYPLDRLLVVERKDLPVE